MCFFFFLCMLYGCISCQKHVYGLNEVLYNTDLTFVSPVGHGKPLASGMNMN